MTLKEKIEREVYKIQYIYEGEDRREALEVLTVMFKEADRQEQLLKEKKNEKVNVS
jgi:hypothetical protein